MKYQLITLFLIGCSVCYAEDISASIVVNNVTEPIPTVSVVPPGPPGNDSTPNPPNTTTTSTTTVSPPTTTTTVKPPTTTNATTTTTTVSPPTTTNKTTTTTATTPTTSKPSNVTTTKTTSTKPPVTTAVPPAPTPSSNRKFDGPSFVGGIVLASGLMAIGFVAFKFYKARTELNYHTL